MEEMLSDRRCSFSRRPSLKQFFLTLITDPRKTLLQIYYQFILSKIFSYHITKCCCLVAFNVVEIQNLKFSKGCVTLTAKNGLIVQSLAHSLGMVRHIEKSLFLIYFSVSGGVGR